MTTCPSPLIGPRCTGSPDRIRSIFVNGHRENREMCAGCEETARLNLLEPDRRLDASRHVEARRGRPFVPVWRRRNLAKDLTGVR